MRLVRVRELVAAFEKIEAARGAVALTFFEFNALAALLIFEAAQLDAWVLEMGMGGRLDAVNVVDPAVAVVTSIGLDHQEYLGDTLEAIAREKAGIFRPGEHRRHRRPRALAGSRECGAQHRGAAETARHRIQLYSARAAVGATAARVGTCRMLPAPALAGDIQFANAATALAALEEIWLSAEHRRRRHSTRASARCG